MTTPLRSALPVALATFALALILRLAGLDARPAWLDEIYTQFAVSRDWYGLAADRISRGHSPLYFAILKALGLPPENIVALRVPAAVFDSLAAAVMTGALAVFSGRRAALIFGLLYAASPVAIHWSQNARPYGLMTLGIAIGLAGAMGLLSTLGREVADDDQGLRRSRRLFGAGFVLAAYTITAGAISFFIVAALPFALKRTRQDRAFMARWRRALKLPGILALLVYLAISNPHIARQMDGYWAEKYTTLGFEGLASLWTDLLTNGAGGDVIPLPALGGTGYVALVWALSLALLWPAWRGLRAAGAQPALLAPAFLALGYSGLLIVLSAWTSILVTRYFLPPWMALLVLAAVGMAEISRRKAGMVLVLALLAGCGVFGLNKAFEPPSSRAAALGPMGTLVGKVPQETMRMLYEPGDGTRAEVIMELFTVRLGRPELDRPSIRSFEVGLLRESLETKPDVFAYLGAGTWEQAVAEGAPAPLCERRIDDWLLLYWGSTPEVCAD